MNSAIQPQGATNNGNLFIPNKSQMTTYDPTKYGTDMRAIERWCNSLLAGQSAGEIVLFQQSYITTGCGPGLFSVPVFPLAKLGPSLNANATFVAPSSGTVKAKASIFLQLGAATHTPTEVGIVIAFVDTATGLVRESSLEMCLEAMTSSTVPVGIFGSRVTYESIVSGLTPGTTYNWTLGGYALPSFASYTAAAYGVAGPAFTSGPYGPVLITVYAA